MTVRLFNVGLRLASLAAKLLLTLYMGRWFAMDEIGTYGLVAGAVAVLGVVMGQDFIYVGSRDIVGRDDFGAAKLIRDQAAVYGMNYLALTAAAFLLGFRFPPGLVAATALLAILESFGTVTQNNLNAMNRQVHGNAFFFIRSAAWVLPVIGLGLLDPAWRTAEAVILAWIAGAALSLAATFRHWRFLPWREALALPVDGEWIRKGLATSWPVWIGMMGLTAGTYADRLIVEAALTREDVGTLTFYFSFAAALVTLMQSGVTAFATPRLIGYHNAGESGLFSREARRAFLQTALGGLFAALLMGACMPFLTRLTGKEALAGALPVFWMMLAGAWLRAVSEALKATLYARRQDRAVWRGNLLYLVPALGFNVLLVPLVGLAGIGVSGIAAGLFLTFWCAWHLRDLTHAG